MKIVFFARRFYPLIGGVEKHVLEISRLLIDRGHTVTVITENNQSMSSIAKFEGINIVRINVGTENFFKKFKVWIKLIRYIPLIKNADIIHCHDIFFWYLPFKFIFPLKKVYVTFHGYEGNKIPNHRAKLMHKMAEMLTNGNICIGNFYKKWYGTKATFISFGAVDNKLIEQGKINNRPKKEAMFLGRLEDETGFFEYLNAVKELNISLDIYGEGSLESEAKKYVKKNKLNVNFKGFVEDATNYIKDYKYIFTSRYLGILEAMAVKRPVFATYNNDIKKDYLANAPFAKFISISNDSKQLFEIVNSYEKGDTKINIDKAYDWVKNNTWEDMANVYIKLWNKNFKI